MMSVVRVCGMCRGGIAFIFAAILPIEALAIQIDQPPPTEEEIVVLGKLDVAKIGFKLRDGRLKCKIRKGTGNRRIDALACAAVENCYARYRSFDRGTMECIPVERRRLVRSYVAGEAA